MKKTLIRLAAFALACTIILITSACSTATKLEKALGVSYDNIVCQYTFSDDYPTNVTFYADNTVRLWTNDRNDGDVVIAEVTAQITEEQKNDLIKAIRENELLALADCSNIDLNSTNWEWHYIIFYDADGNRVHHCGGMNPTEPRFIAVVNLICEYFPESCELFEELYKATAAK